MMPENEKNEMRDVQADTPVTETKMQKLERERLTRRAALRKMGYTSALSVLALFSVDDLARMVGKAMQQQAKDNAVADLVARELRQAGVAMANGASAGTTCQHCANEFWNELCWCSHEYNTGDGVYPNQAKLAACNGQAGVNDNACKQNCVGTVTTTPTDCTTLTEPPGWSG